MAERGWVRVDRGRVVEGYLRYYKTRGGAGVRKRDRAKIAGQAQRPRIGSLTRRRHGPGCEQRGTPGGPDPQSQQGKGSFRQDGTEICGVEVAQWAAPPSAH